MGGRWGESPSRRTWAGVQWDGSGLTDACRCVLERIPWIFTWLLLAVAKSTHSPLRRASAGP